MVRKEDDGEGDASETLNATKVQNTGVAAGTNSAPMPHYTASALQALQGNQHLSILDPNVMMMTNAAATIAAVAATAVQQINHGTTSPLPATSAGAPASSITPGLISALRSGGAANPKPSISPQVAALLAAVGAAHPSLQLQGSTPSISGHLRLNSTDPSALHPATSATTLSPASTSPPTISGMQTRLFANFCPEKHVSLLQQLNQPVPQSVALLLADAQRKEKKKTAKRAANRKSASTSRARKKALVEEMTRTNARLKRQALILALLPDLVIATTLEGEITFCSDQVQRELGHKSSELPGASLYQLLAPASRDALKTLIHKLTISGKPERSRQSQPPQGRGTKRRHSDQKDNGNAAEIKNNENSGKGNSNKSGRGSSRASGGNSGETSGAAVVSEQSFPPSVVNVESKRSASSNGKGDTSEAAANNVNVNSDNSTSNNSGSGSKQQVSSLSNATGLSRSPTESQSEDDGAQGASHDTSQGSKDKDNAKGKQHSSSDDSSLSSDAKNMSKANDNLDRNVRWHNQRMMEDNQKAKSDDGPKDDVTGASVTANNASARLSSLQHVPEVSTKKEEKAPGRYENNGDQSSSSDDSLLAGVEEKKKVENASDDSGYRESNDSREESSCSGSDSSNSNDRKKSLTPTCRLCLIREDLTTVWCEVTSSLRSRSPEEDQQEAQTNESKESTNDAIDSTKVAVKEVLLCLRPLRDGEKKVDESLRFVAPKKVISEEGGLAEAQVSSTSGGINSNSPDKRSSDRNSSGDGSNSNSTSSDPADVVKRPPKKRPMGDKLVEEKSMGTLKKAKVGHAMTTHPASDTEKSVVESLMLMNKSH